MSERIKGAALARKFGAPKTAAIIPTACYGQIFATAIEEIGVERLAAALAQAKNAAWAYFALCDIRDLTEAQRTQLCTVIIEAKNAYSAYCALRDIHDLTEAQRASLRTIAKQAA